MSAPTTSLGGRHALICGASSGLGRATALAFAAAGARLTVLARSAEKLEALVDEALAAGAPEARAQPADLEERDLLAEALDETLDGGPVHILVNNAGGPPGGPLLEAEDDDFEQTFRRHLLASHYLVKRCVPGMREAGYGRILNIISTSVREPIPGLGVSNTIRGAVASWAKTLSKELPPGITINNLLPGFTDTDRLGQLKAGNAARQGVEESDIERAWLASVPEGRLGRPEELAALAAFLASPAGAFVRGQSIAVDGGRLNSI